MPATTYHLPPRQNRGKLRARIQKRYQVKTCSHAIGGLTISFTQIEEPDRVLDEVVAEADRREKLAGRREHEDELHLPYWAELWDSALGVGEWIARERAAPPALNVLDLGCGMGFAGTVAAAMGHRVLFADIEPEALLFARLNAMNYISSPRARRFDWRRDRLGERFDLIIGADLLYDKTQWTFLDEFWRAHLAEQGGIILGEPGRQTGEMFVDWIKPRGWKLEQSQQKVATRPTPIRLFHLYF